MKFALLVTVGACLLLGAANAEIELDNDVLVITKDNLKEALEKYEYILFEYCEYRTPRSIGPGSSSLPLSPSFSRCVSRVRSSAILLHIPVIRHPDSFCFSTRLRHSDAS
jgi:hypothetical protein